jgi:hypothetical protein
MLTLSDLIRIPYTSDLTKGGIAYACRFLACTYDSLEPSPLDQLRRIVARVAVELAFRRYLTGQVIPFAVLDAAPFTLPERYDVSLGGHRCNMQSYLVSHRSQISQVLRDLGILLQAPALIPLDQFAAAGHKPDDLYLFAFLLGVVAASQEDMGKAIAAGQPVHFIHILPEPWARPANWLPLGKLALKSECDSPITVEIGGQDADRTFVTSTLTLPPRQRMLVEKSFHSLAYFHAQPRPNARIGIHSLVHGEPYLIPPHAWGNLWVYGMDILFTGWLTHADYRRKARVLKAGAFTFQYDHAHVKNLLVPIRELEPLGKLLEMVRLWEAERRLPNPSS